MNDSMRVAATVIIWIAFTVIVAVMAAAITITQPIVDGSIAVMVLAIMLMLTVAVISSMRAVWQGNSQKNQPAESRGSGKLKHRDPRRIERLIETLDDDEVYDLEALLLAREQEAEHHRNVR